MDPRIEALQAYLKAHASPTFSLPAVAKQPPLITWAGPLHGSLAATTLSGGVVIPASSPLIGGPIRHHYTRILSGNPTVEGHPCLGLSRPYVSGGVSRTVGSPTIMRFITDAPVFELSGVVANGSVTVQTLLVNGELVPPKVLASGRVGAGGGWNYGTIRVDLGSRGIRDIWIQTALAVAYLKVDAQDTVFPVDDTQVQLTVIGDSYQAARSGTFGNGSAIALELGTRLGIRKIAVDGIGGTGYWNSGEGLGNLTDRLPAHAADGSTIYVVMAGLNDYGDITASRRTVWPTRATYEQGVAGYLQSLRTAQPDALIVVTAPFCPVPSLSDSSYVSHVATNTSGMGDFLYKAEVHRNAVQQIPGPWVYIDVLLGGGWLNSSGASGDVTHLQWLTGGTPAAGTTATYKPGNTNGGAGGGFGGIASIPVLDGGRYAQAPEISASGGSGSGLLLASTIDDAGAIIAIRLVSQGQGYTADAGLPVISIDTRFELSPATVGPPQLLAGINPDGQYPLAEFAPPGTSTDALNNIYVMLAEDKIHPSPVGASHLASRLAQNIFEAVMAL